MLVIYKIFYTLLVVPILHILGLFSKKIKAGSKEKFGNYNFKSQTPVTWIHAVSVGEVMLASSLINKMQGDIILTTSTPQGQELAINKLSDKCKKITYFPYDTDKAVNNAIDAINPKKVIIVETEIWPNFASILNKRGIPLYIINGRISERTFESYKKLKFFFKNILKNYTGILTQTEEDAQRFIQTGAPCDKVINSGNIKFDLQEPDEGVMDYYSKLLQTQDKNVLVFGSTHADENAQLIELYKKLKEKINNLKLIIAPRHLEKVPQIEQLLNGLNWGKRSNNAEFNQNDIIILDTTGELGKIYSVADVCLIGGSFNKTGGHNPLEATVWGKPAITGPNIKNFRYIYKSLCELECAFVAKDAADAGEKIYQLLSDKKYMEKIRSNCKIAIEKNSGATDFTLNYLKEQHERN